VSSGIEAFAQRDSWECCKFRGKLIALDAATGKILWNRYTTDQEPQEFTNRDGRKMWGPSGGAIWSAPTIDPKRRRIYVATSNSYTDVPHDGADAVLALDIETGAVVWRRQVTEGDDYMMGCYFASNPRAANCPQTQGGDYALGNSPILHRTADGKDVILAGQKSSEVYAMDPDADGKILWQHRLSVGSELGGVEFGMAADPEAIYVPISDVVARDWGRPGITAIRVNDGQILWTQPSPRNTCWWRNFYCSPAMSQAATSMPGLVFAGAMDGRLRAYETATGKVVWEFNTGGDFTSVLGKTVKGGILDGGGPTIADGMLYVNTGYAGRTGQDGAVLLAFSVDGK
jgi:polyvinyl alcohol dehydrogenase (cytochrome)